jgi:hypothetical protein
MKQYPAIHILLGGVFVLAITLFYLLLAPSDRSGLYPWQWVLFAAFTAALMLAVFGPSVMRRRRGLPPQPLPPSDIRFSLAVAAVLCPLAFFAIVVWGPFGSLVIMLAPIAFIFRYPRRGLRNTNDPNP